MAIPSAFGPNRSSNQFGAGSLSGGLSNLISSSGGLGNTLATPVGRSSFDPQRMAEQAIRRARQQGDFTSAFRVGALATNLGQQQQQFNQEQQGWQKVGEMFNKMTGQQTPQFGAQMPGTEQAGWANKMFGGDTGSRQQNVQQAMKDPTKFAAIQQQYNKMAQAAGRMMDDQGNIVPLQPTATTTQNPATLSIGSAMGF